MKKRRRRQRQCDQRPRHAVGERATLDQYLKMIDEGFDRRVVNAKNSYEIIAAHTTLAGKDLRDYCRDRMLWEVQFDGEGELVPLEEVIQRIEEQRVRYKESRQYRYYRRTVHKDNQKLVYNSGGGHFNCNTVRVPSMKRSNAVWKRFYELFPRYKEHYDEWNGKNGLKLKKVW